MNWIDVFIREEYKNIILNKALEYEHLNPVQASFVTQAEDRKYKSSKDFCGRKELTKLNSGS